MELLILFLVGFWLAVGRGLAALIRFVFGGLFRLLFIIIVIMVIASLFSSH